MDLAHSAATVLDKHNLVKYDRRSGTLQATDLGRCGGVPRGRACALPRCCSGRYQIRTHTVSDAFHHATAAVGLQASTTSASAPSPPSMSISSPPWARSSCCASLPWPTSSST